MATSSPYIPQIAQSLAAKSPTAPTQQPWNSFEGANFTNSVKVQDWMKSQGYTPGSDTYYNGSTAASKPNWSTANDWLSKNGYTGQEYESGNTYNTRIADASGNSTVQDSWDTSDSPMGKLTKAGIIGLAALAGGAIAGVGGLGAEGAGSLAAGGEAAAMTPGQIGALSAVPEAAAGFGADMLPSISSVVSSEAALPGLAGGTVGSEALAAGTALGGEMAGGGSTLSSQLPSMSSVVSSEAALPGLSGGTVGSEALASGAALGGGSLGSTLGNLGSGALSALKANPQLAGALATAGVTAMNQPGAAPIGPSATDTVKAQTDATTQAALLQAALNRVNTVGPTGSTTYSSAANPNTPGGFDYTQTTALSPEQQKIFDANQSSTLKQSQLLDALTGTLGKSLQTPMDFSSVPGLKTSAGDPATYYQQAADAAYDRQKQYLDPQVQQQQQALEARLAEQGFVPGTPGYNQAMQNFQDTNNRSYAAARDSAIQQGVSAGQGIFSGNLSNAQLNNNASGQTLAQLLQERNQPLNELNAVKTGTQVQLPTAPGIAQVSTPATNVSGITNQAYQNQLGVYNANVGSSNATNQSLSQLLAALGTTYSDARLKSGIIPLGRTPGGASVYEYTIFGERQIGVIAQELQLSQPNAVLLNPENGFLMVNYREVR